MPLRLEIDNIFLALSIKETCLGFLHSSLNKESACNAGDSGSITGSGRSLGEGNGNPLQYSHLENPMDRVAWQATVHSGFFFKVTCL